MALAVAAPLSRFFARTPADVDRLRPGVEAWRDDLRASVAEGVRRQLVWDERADVCSTADLGASGWLAVRLFACVAELPELDLPDTVPPLLELDATWRAAADTKFARSRFGQLLACRLWLPGDFPVTLRVPLPDGETAEVGSLAVLADQLKWLNQRTFQADADEVRAWADLPAEPGGPLLPAARRGYAALAAAAAVAVRERVPLVVREP